MWGLALGIINYFTFFLIHPTADLLRAPFLLYQSFDIGPSTAVNTGPDFSLPSVFRKCIGLFGPIAPTSSIPFKFSTHGRFMNANHFGNL